MIIHIVEDDCAVADAISMALANGDMHPRVYPDGETFLATAGLSEDDWVIVDLGLPGISGTEVVRKLEQTVNPPRMIAITGKSHMNISDSMRLVPHLKVLRKPLSIEMLTAVMV